LKKNIIEPQVQVKFDELDAVCCDECGSEHWVMMFLLRKVSALLAPTGKQTMVPAQTYRCADCGHVNKELMPK